MQNENTAAATAMVPSGPETNNEITFEGVGLSPAALKLKIQNDKEMRQILTKYVQDELKEGHHFSETIGTQKLAKPMLLDEGARNICALFSLFFGEPVLYEEWLDEGHYRVRAHIGVFNRRGEQVASGDALCSTRESKYAFRKAERTCPKCEQAAIRKDNKKAEGGWYCWSKLDGCGAQFPANEEAITSQQLGRVDNPDLADTENTVLKIAIKRAKVAAVRDLPVVSEIFAPESEPPASAGGQSAGNNSSSPQQGKGRNSSSAPPPRHADEGVRVPAQSPVEVVCGFIEKLVDLGEPIADLKELYLPGGVNEFADLSPEQAEEIRGDVNLALNAKLKKSN